MEHFAQIETFFAVLLQLCGAVVAIGAVIALGVKFYKWLRKPTDDLQADREEMRSWFAADKRRLEELERRQDEQDEKEELMLTALLHIMSHEIDGDHQAQLVSTRDEIQSFLIKSHTRDKRRRGGE